MGLFLLLYDFFLVVLATTVLGTEHPLEVGAAFVLVEYDGGVALAAVVIMVFLVLVLVSVTLLLNFCHFRC